MDFTARLCYNHINPNIGSALARDRLERQHTMLIDSFFNRFNMPDDISEALSKCTWRCYPETKEQLEELCYGPTRSSDRMRSSHGYIQT